MSILICYLTLQFVVFLEFCPPRIRFIQFFYRGFRHHHQSVAYSVVPCTVMYVPMLPVLLVGSAVIMS